MTRHIAAAQLSLLLALVALMHESHAAGIANSCAVPKIATQHRTFYVDPVKGSMSNDGSAERPWRTLAEVLDSKRKLIAAPSAPIKPGDVLYLNNGDHGHVQTDGANNKDFVTVQAAPNQTPILRSLRVNGSKWIFTGLKIQGSGDGSEKSPSGFSLIEFGRNRSSGPTDNIVFTNNSISTVDDTSAWTDLDWVKKPYLFSLFSSATCVSITSNHFFNLRNAIQFDGDHHLIADNKFNNFGNDAIEIVASNATVQNNTITNGRHSKSEPLHPDGIQGWTRPGVINTNVLIDGNIIIKTGDSQISEMQGIGIFDGRWDGLTISNNVVITNHWHGISVSGVSNTRIINNTVVAFDPANRPTWIKVSPAKDGTSSAGVVVRNNITTRLVYPETGVSVDHNIVSQRIDTAASGKPTYNSKPGTYGNSNIVDPNIYRTLLRIDHATGTYDLRLGANSPAIGAGSSDLAPPIDILRKRRVPPIDIGAYASYR